MAMTYKDIVKHARIEDIQWDGVKHSITINGMHIALTRTEYQLFLPLKRGLPITYADLAYDVYDCRIDEKVLIMIDKHIDRIRAKLYGSGIYIYCILHYGYILFPENQ